jgi:hypothetical protein
MRILYFRNQNILIFHIIIFASLIIGTIYLTRDEGSYCPNG